MSTTIYKGQGDSIQVDVCGGPRGSTMIQINAPRFGPGFVQIDRDAAIAVAVAILGHFKPLPGGVLVLDDQPPPCCSDFDDAGLHTPKCDRKCTTEHCLYTATIVAHWPGKSVAFCEECMDRARNVAAAMGFVLSTSPVGAPEPHGARRG